MHSIYFAPRAGSARSTVRASFGKSQFQFKPGSGSGGSILRIHRAWRIGALAVVSCCVAVVLSGCGSIEGGGTAAGTGALVASSNALSFGTVTVGQRASATVSLKNESTNPVQISQISVSGQSFALMGQSTLPLTIAAAGTYSVSVQFQPTVAGAAAGNLTVTSNSASGNPIITLSGTGAAAGSSSPPGATLSALSCSSANVTGTDSDSCVVTLSAPAGNGGVTVTLASNDAALTVPTSVTIAANTSTAAFTAYATTVSAAQSATITATLGTTSLTCDLQLEPEQSSGGTPALSLSAESVDFGDITVNTAATPQVITLTSSGTAALTITAAAVTGSGFSVSGAGFPVTLNPGQAVGLQVKFDPTNAGAVTGSLTIVTNAPVNGTATISLSGTGDATAGVLSALTCTNATMTAAGTDACTVSLTAAAPTGGLVVTLASSSASVTLPPTVTVAGGATSAGFSATVAAFGTTQTATLSATARGTTKTFALQLSVAAAGLTIGSTSVSFGDVDLNTPATQTVTLTSSGTAALTISSGTPMGTGFTMSGVTFPVTLNSGQTATLDLQFDPTTSGAATGSVTLTSNATGAATATIALSGTGVSATGYEVQLTWDAPSSTTDPAVGYNIYRAVNGSASYTLLNSSVNAPTTYTDTTVQDGTSYTYEVTSVDASGVQSAPSNTYTAAIP
jgi:hypothetical protein